MDPVAKGMDPAERAVHTETGGAAPADPFRSVRGKAAPRFRDVIFLADHAFPGSGREPLDRR